MANDPLYLFPLFDDNPDVKFEFVAVTDINMSDYPHFFKGVFRNINTNEEIYVDNVYSEAIKQRYSIGCIYRNKEFVRIASNVKRREFKINNNPCSLLQKISDVINEEDIRFINHETACKDFMEQYAHIEVKKNSVLIIPCSLIAIHFYLLYGQMKKVAMDGMLENLYDSASFKVETFDNGTTEAYLEAKSHVAPYNMQDLIRLANSKYAQTRFCYIFMSKQKDKSFQAIRCRFPTAAPFKAKLLYLQIGKDEREKPKYLALHMDTNDIGYDFDQARCVF